MESSGGMVAVVRGLKDAGLAVTLLDAGRQYTLLPEAASQCASEVAPAPRESGVQVTDGRYTSTYKMMHCHMIPTSPPDLVTEFPPQKAELCPGHENFEIGGTGSGGSHLTRCNSVGGANHSPDKGSAFSQKPAVRTDFFAGSLRRYPDLSPDRSSEIVERLITFTQAKNETKNPKCNSLCNRNIDSETSNQALNLEMNLSAPTTPTKCPHRGYARDSKKRHNRLEESPTRERAREGPVDHDTLESWRRSAYGGSNEVRHLRDVPRKVRDGIRTLGHCPSNQPEKLNARDRLSSNTTERSVEAQLNTNSMNMEIQASVQMVSREVVTSPVAVPSQRTIAVPLSPSTSHADRNLEDCSHRLTTLEKMRLPTQMIKSEVLSTDIQATASAAQLGIYKHTKYKRSKSEVEIRIVQNESSHFLQSSHLPPGCSKFQCKSHGRIYSSNKFCTPRNAEYNSKRDNRFCKHELDRVTANNNSKELKRFRSSYARIFHGEVTPPCTNFDEEKLARILKDWLNLIPIKPEEYFDGKVDKELVFCDFFDSLKHLANNPLDINTRDRIKINILDKLDLLPIEVKGNRRVFLCRLADILITKMKHMGCKKYKRLREMKQFKEICNPTCEKYIAPTEAELQMFLSAELTLHLEKMCLKINRRRIKEIEDDLLDCVMFSMEEKRLGNEKLVKNSIIKLLQDYGFSEYQATSFTNILITHLTELFRKTATPAKIRSDTLIVHPNIQNVERISKLTACDSDISIKGNKSGDTIVHQDSYNNDLCRQIDEWLSNLKLPIPETKQNGAKQVIINDLARDIIDRHKYLKLNPSSKATDEAELEYLKYQIFKWINKLVGEDNLVPTEHAPELMRRVQEITVPASSNLRITNMNNRSQITYCSNVLSRNQPPMCRGCDNDFKDSSSKTDKCNKVTSKNENTMNIENVPNCSKNYNNMSMSHAGTFRPNIVFENVNITKCNQKSKATCGLIIKKSNQSIKPIDQLEAEYEQFVKNWVQQIPVQTPNPEDEMKVRVGIYNGLWKVVSKLNCDPATYYNRFFYEDLLEDAIDDLLDCLPQTSDLISRRHLLKIEFIEKTVNINDYIKANEKVSFKNKLITNVLVNLRKHSLTNNISDDSMKMQEDLQIIKLAEEYLLFIRYKNDNKVISEVFKKKLLRQIEDFIEDLKKNHDTELKPIDGTIYKTDVMTALETVPLPSEKVLKDEADDVLFGNEVEQWYTDLPIIPNQNSINPYQRKKQLDMLAKKIKEMENNVSDVSETAIRKEISNFLKNVSVINGESLNTNCIVDELINRIKHMKQHGTSLLQGSKKVAFQNYEDYRKDIPYSSSFNENLTYQNLSPPNENNINTKRNSIQRISRDESRLTHTFNTKSQTDTDNTSKVLTNIQKHDNIQELPDYKTFSEERPISSSFNESPNQWYSLKENYDHTQSQDIPMHEPQNFVSFSQQKYPGEIQKVHKVNNGIKNVAVNRNYYQNTGLRSSLGKEEQTISSGEEQTSSIQFNPQVIRTSRGMLGTSQVAGPSTYKQVDNATNVPFNDDLRDQLHSQEYIPFEEKASDVEEINHSFNKSIGCQTVEKVNLYEKEKINNTFDYAPQTSVGTNTSSDHTSVGGQPIYISTSRNDAAPTIPRKKRAKWALLDKDANERRLNFNESDDEEDDIPCRCIERFWKSRRRSKYFSCEEFRDYPPCFPMLFPYPCFF